MKLAALALSLCALTACEKASLTSGQLDAETLALLHDIPGGNSALFVGDYARIQESMLTVVDAFAERAFGSAGSDAGAFHTWTACFGDAGPMRIVAGVAISPAVQFHSALRGVTIDKVAECATRAGYPYTVDPDHKFIAISLPQGRGRTMQSGYLELHDGALYMSMQIVPGRPATIVPTLRADLETETAKLAGASAADDKALMDLALKADRSKTVWFVVAPTGTSLGLLVHDAHAAIGLDAQSMHVDATIRFASPALAAKFDDSITQLRHGDEVQPVLESVLDNVVVTHAGDTVHGTLTISTDELRDLTKLMKR